DPPEFRHAVADPSLGAQGCKECRRGLWHPRPICPPCHASDPTWTTVGGDARGGSWTVLPPPVLTVWQDKLPFVILLVELDDAPGVRMVGQLVDAAGELLQTDGTAQGVDFGVRLTLRWRVDEAGQTLPAWTAA